MLLAYCHELPVLFSPLQRSHRHPASKPRNRYSFLLPQSNISFSEPCLFENMLALRAKIEGGWALISRPGFSGFLFFRYVNTILGSKSQFIVWFPRDRNKPGLCRMSELTMTTFSAIQIPAIILQHLNDHVEGFITPADEKRARVGWMRVAIHPTFTTRYPFHQYSPVRLRPNPDRTIRAPQPCQMTTMANRRAVSPIHA
uniref:Uncharacterized protein n=1 Tax=Candidatus Kentrum sp. UNK TaxID=2126344 RepID=A0A451B6D6_9GAMM|nr:MAG: hypothetical protein BECKUNK1418G_GA0071005_13202 [Candidatus Kentron sp. UNK]VFK73826.1 MAG: hypothetical protein BECKUNK1418H_GA0071006_13082 [Candidatus Kentron sp. UNK]